MGAWGFGPFENDDALDWAQSFVESEDGLSGGQTDEPGKIDLIVGPLALAAGGMEDEDDEDGDGESEEGEGGDYVEADLASHAIAAAEVIAAVRGKSHPDLSGQPKPVDEDDGGGDIDEDGDEDDIAEGEDSLQLIAKWVKGGSDDHETLRDEGVREVAIQALERIRDESELAELWSDAEPEHAQAWKDYIADLIKRLGG